MKAKQKHLFTLLVVFIISLACFAGACGNTNNGSSGNSGDEAECSHEIIRIEKLNFADYGMCGGYVFYKTCKCGKTKVLDVNYADDDAKFDCALKDPENDDETLEDGSFVYVTSIKCTICLNAFKVTLKGDESHSCVNVADGTFEILDKNGKNLLEMPATLKETSHNEIEKEIELSKYGACGGTIGYVGCSHCDEITSDFFLDGSKCFEGVDHDALPKKEYTDKNGVKIAETELKCKKCGLTITQKFTSYEYSVCAAYVGYYTKIEKGGVILLEYGDNYPEVAHDYKYDVKLNAETCLSGGSAKMTCEKCGDERSFTFDTHPWEYTEKITVDLTEKGLCSGEFSYKKCGFCGENFELFNDYESSSYGGYYDSHSGWKFNRVENGYIVYACDECGVEKYYKSEEKQFDRKNYDGCNRFLIIECIYKKDGKEIYSIKLNNPLDFHKFVVYSRTLYGESCKDGVDVVEKCVYCGYEEKETYDIDCDGGYMVFSSKVYDIRKFGSVCRGYVSLDGCACGKKSNYSVRTTCDFEQMTQNIEKINGIVYETGGRKCKICGLEVIEKRHSVKVGCKKTNYIEIAVKLGSSTILDGFTMQYENDDHAEVCISGTLKGETCKDGYTLTYKCRDCGRTRTEDYSSGSDHFPHITETYEFKNFGYIQKGVCVCGEYINVNFCACPESEHTQTTEIINGKEYDVVKICCEDCNYEYIQKSYSESDGENTHYYYIESFKIGGEVKFENLTFEHIF